MRCPYCGGMNPDRASFCALCGRDLSAKAPTVQNSPRQTPLPGRPTYPPPQQPYQPSSVPPAPPGGQPARPVAPAATPRKAPGVPQGPSQVSTTTAQPARSATIEPPVPFPPRTVEQLKQLEQGALPYTVLSEVSESGRKKIVTISYARGAAWQQVATLLKALKEQQATTFDIVIVQGFVGQQTDAYHFTNGWLQFDRNVRLGSQTQNRYQIETGNGFDADSVRIVMSE